MATPTARLLARLVADDRLPPAQAEAIADDERARSFSLHYELQAGASRSGASHGMNLLKRVKRVTRRANYCRKKSLVRTGQSRAASSLTDKKK